MDYMYVLKKEGGLAIREFVADTKLSVFSSYNKETVLIRGDSFLKWKTWELKMPDLIPLALLKLPLANSRNFKV